MYLIFLNLFLYFNEKIEIKKKFQILIKKKLFYFY